MALLIDESAKRIALDRWALPVCLNVPIAAIDEDAIRNYVGNVERVVSGRGLRKALLVTVPEHVEIDPLLSISDHPNAAILHARQQVWVHVAYKPYRAAYKRALPDENINGLILSHAMNRVTAVYKGFDFVRLTPVSGVANVSSAFSEQWAKGTAQTEGARRHPPRGSTLHSICRSIRPDVDARHDARGRRDGCRQRRPEIAGTKAEGIVLGWQLFPPFA